MDVLGRDDELRSLRAFVNAPAAPGMTAVVLEGQAGIGKSTLWLAGVQAARERGLRVLSARPAEVELGVGYAGLGDLLEGALGDVLPELAVPRRRALETVLLSGMDPMSRWTLGPSQLQSATRSSCSRTAEPIVIAVDDVQWLDASSTTALAFALRRLPAQNIHMLLSRRAGAGIPVRRSSSPSTSA